MWPIGATSSRGLVRRTTIAKGQSMQKESRNPRLQKVDSALQKVRRAEIQDCKRSIQHCNAQRTKTVSSRHLARTHQKPFVWPRLMPL